jgi:hypothetical protein
LTKGKLWTNIYIDGTYDGATNENGQFSFSTTTDKYLLLVFFYETSKTTINVADFQNKTIVLLESSNTLDAVDFSGYYGNR